MIPPEPQNLRLFVAVTVPAPLLEELDRALGPLRGRLGPAARWIPIENRHVTLRFLGRTSAARLDEVRSACAATAGGLAASEVALAGIGAFPSLRRARVLWVGLDDPVAVLAGAASALESRLEPLGYPAEERAFAPHLTLARFRSPVPVEASAGAAPGDLPIPTEPFLVDRLRLFRSHLHPKGARYEVLDSFALAS